ncbi:hypothetical protein DFH09DRAFT_1086572 [Mycena vulgaris]|nr:hypothetical protein DFH09DRAFT_1086572 [Mycena vulgaris]
MAVTLLALQHSTIFDLSHDHYTTTNLSSTTPSPDFTSRTSHLGNYGSEFSARKNEADPAAARPANVDYVPAVPSVQTPHAVFLRSDMRYGTDDPTLWPQQFAQQFCHLTAIAQKGTCPELEVMGYNAKKDTDAEKTPMQTTPRGISKSAARTYCFAPSLSCPASLRERISGLTRSAQSRILRQAVTMGRARKKQAESLVDATLALIDQPAALEYPAED